MDANYRAVLRARSKAELYNKLSIVVEETDVAEMWLELLIESKISNNEDTLKLHSESLELPKILQQYVKNYQSNLIQTFSICVNLNK